MNTETKVLDEATRDDTVTPLHFEITSYGADYDVEGMVKRLQRKDIIIPFFQRSFVWSLNESARFIESLLLGLPVPGVFLATEKDTNRLLVIDGQQRLKTLQFFYEGFFNPKPTSTSQRVFKLAKVQKRFEHFTYLDLKDADRRRLDNAIIHATVFKQDRPKDDDTSMFHIFERLNNSGKKLNPQEIRVTIYHGRLMETIRELNQDAKWRSIFGALHNRLKDQELILRFLALFYEADRYNAPLKDFLNKFPLRHQNDNDKFMLKCSRLFVKTVGVVRDTLGDRAFRPEGVFNAAVFDSVMYGIGKGVVEQGHAPNGVKRAYDKLVMNKSYLESVSRATSDNFNVARRLTLSKQAFS